MYMRFTVSNRTGVTTLDYTQESSVCVEAALAEIITCRQEHVDGSYCKDGLQKEALSYW